MNKTWIVVALALGTGMAVGCGPTLSTQVRLETARAQNNPGTVSKNGLAIEVPDLKALPPQLIVNVATCGANGQPLADPVSGAAVTRDVTVVAPGTELYQVKLSNQTDHVVRLQGSVIRLFDPAENQIEPQSKDDAWAAAMRTLGERGVCPQEGVKVQGAFATIKLIGPNTELLPGTTTTGYLLFVPPDLNLPGTWKLSLYEVPVKVDANGAPVEKAKFDFGYLRTKYEDTFTQTLTGPKTLVSTREVQ